MEFSGAKQSCHVNVRLLGILEGQQLGCEETEHACHEHVRDMYSLQVLTRFGSSS